MRKFFSWAIPAGVLVFAASGFWAPGPRSAFDVEGFARLPVLNGGRVKPLDSLARNSLLVFSGNQTIENKSAAEWFLDVAFNEPAADAAPVFQVDNPDVLGVLGILQTRKRRFSLNEMKNHMDDAASQAARADDIKPERRSPFQSAAVRLRNDVFLHDKLKNTLQPAGLTEWSREIQIFDGAVNEGLEIRMRAEMKKAPSPHAVESVREAFRERYRALSARSEYRPLPERAADGNVRWSDVGEKLAHHVGGEDFHPGVKAFAQMGDAYRTGDAASFHGALASYGEWLEANYPSEIKRARAEALFNRVEPFYKSLVIYALVCLLVFLSWLKGGEIFSAPARRSLVLAFAIHTAGLAARVILQGRPPVTNLYSSAVFVGWAAVLLGIILERIYKNGLGALAAGVVGFLTQIVAHHLATQGDTMEMMRAVLDSNFWLATHVVCVTVGYSSTFLSGIFGVVYILRDRFGKGLDEETKVSFARMAYGVICFSAFFSFTGTVLGGIWADQSWGRFWGWDPKENGALMIVLWNAFILHARWGGFIRERGLMTLAVFGNVVTALSWFGVNMLGIGLHSYGFMDKAFPWLAAFVFSQSAVIVLGLKPRPR